MGDQYYMSLVIIILDFALCWYVILSSTENIANKLDTIHKKIMYPVEVVVLNPNGIIN